MLVKSILVPDVEATAVPDVITLDAIELRTAPEIDGDVPNTTAPEPVEVVTPVPPLTTGKAVPDNVIANVPVVVIGEPETDKNDGTVAATLVTVPVAESLEVIVKLGYVPVMLVVPAPVNATV